jgi:hypothetical protein
MGKQAKLCQRQKSIQGCCLQPLSPKQYRFLDFYTRRFSTIAASLVGIYCAEFLTYGIPLIFQDARSPDRTLFQISLIVVGPVGGGVLFLSLHYFRNWAVNRLGYSIGRPFLVASTEVPKVRIGNLLAALDAGFNGLVLNSNRHRESMKRALRSPYLNTLDSYDEFENRLDAMDWVKAFDALQRIFDPAVLPFARSTIFEAYGDALRDYTVLSEVKSWFGRQSLAAQMRVAIAYFVREHYQACVTKFRIICSSDKCDPEAKKACVKMIDLVLGVAAIQDPHWQRLRANFWANFPEFTAGNPANVLPH